MRADRRDPTIAEIKKYKCTALVVHMRTGDPRTVPVPTKSNRWELLSDTLAKLDWTSIECVDREGQLLGIVEGDDEPEETDRADDRDERMARLMMQIVHTTQQQTAALYAQQMGSFVELATATTAGLRAVQETYATALRVQAAALAGANDAAAGDGDIMKMLQMAAMMQHKPPPPPAIKPQIRKPTQPPLPPAQTNGVAKPPAT